MPPTPAPTGPRDVTQSCTAEQLLEVRQRALELAHSWPLNGNGVNGTTRESDSQRRQRITADAAAYVEFILAGKIAG